jgi:diguanylate cyclase (GGDEF)-like protein
MELEAVQLVLQRWSVGVQLGIVLVLAVFFAILSRSLRLAEVRLWAGAWAANLLALTAVFAAAFAAPPPAVMLVTTVAYVAAKTTYALLIVAGAQHHVRPGVAFRLRPSRLAAVVAAWSLLLVLFAPQLALVQLGQMLMAGGLLIAGAVWVLSNPRARHSPWLAWTMLAQGVLFLHYVPLLTPMVWGDPPLARYVYYSSFYDAGAELLLAMGTLVALQSSVNAHLEHVNTELVSSQEQLRQLADLDPLTALANRRALHGHLQSLGGAGASLVYLDLRDFKRINDRHGHTVGDACLRRVASTLSKAFRADDGLFRWGGDEFLVVARGLDRAGAEKRIAVLRSLLAEPDGDTPAVAISVGLAEFAAGADAETVLREADALLVADKQRQKSRA